MKRRMLTYFAGLRPVKFDRTYPEHLSHDGWGSKFHAALTLRGPYLSCRRRKAGAHL